MNEKSTMKAAIQSVIKSMMDRVMYKVLIEDPFLKDEHKATKPLYAALVPDEIFKGSHFERRFVTPFRQCVGKSGGGGSKAGLGKGDTGYRIDGTVKAERLRRITEILNTLEHSEKGTRKVQPDCGQIEIHIGRFGRGHSSRCYL